MIRVNFVTEQGGSSISVSIEESTATLVATEISKLIKFGVIPNNVGISMSIKMEED